MKLRLEIKDQSLRYLSLSSPDFPQRVDVRVVEEEDGIESSSVLREHLTFMEFLMVFRNVGVLKMNTTSRVYTPKIETFHQL